MSCIITTNCNILLESCAPVALTSVRGLSVMWDGDGVREEWLFFVKAPDFSRKDAVACMPSLVPRRSGRYSVCDAWHRIVRYSS